MADMRDVHGNQVRHTGGTGTGTGGGRYNTGARNGGVTVPPTSTGTQQRRSGSSSPVRHTGGTEQHEKKGVMDKVKDKLPGGQHKQEDNNTGTTGYGATTTPGYDAQHGGNAGTEQHEKKGIMDKVKNMLPGGQQ